ncbi:MAG: hypothetical protein H0V41_05155 [Pseudonocardiales bacterium]|nr:hypothetical protein [Pseudonocardiales bacterium]
MSNAAGGKGPDFGHERLLIKKRGRNLRAGQAGRWTESWFHDQGLHKLLGTIRYPKAAKPCPEDRR